MPKKAPKKRHDVQYDAGLIFGPLNLSNKHGTQRNKSSGVNLLFMYKSSLFTTVYIRSTPHPVTVTNEGL